MARPIIINGLPGTGSTTAAKLLAERSGFEHLYGGGVFRELAAQAGRSLEQFMVELSDNPDLERSVDERSVTRALAGDVIIESRVAAWLMPTDVPSFNVWLTCARPERMRRILQREDTPDAEARVLDRERIDAERYVALYGIDLENHDVYDLVLDTTKLPPAAVVERIISDFS